MEVPKLMPVYLVWRGETLLDAPVEEAWPHVVDYPAWQSYSIVQHVSGKPGREGEVMLLKKEEEGFAFPPYLARTIKLEPQRRIIWKTFPEQGNDYFGIVEFDVREIDGKTRFNYSLLYEFMMPERTEAELEEFYKQQYAATEALFAAVIPKLKKLTERRA
jgi:hypothetical protein